VVDLPPEEQPVTPRSVTVILPCLDEAASVAAAVAEARHGLQAAGLTGEVLVVDNGSTDGSARLARDAGARVVREPEVGYGAALRRGIDEAACEIIVMADADGTYPLDRLGELVAPIVADGSDLVIGSRFTGSEPGAMPTLHRRLGTPVLSFLVRRAAPTIKVRDSQSGFRAMRTGQARHLGLMAPGMEFASEMLIKASLAGLRVHEAETGYRRRLGQSKLHALRDGLRHLQLILLLAPQLVLFWPGLAMLAAGAVLSGVSLANPLGFDLGPLRWQPVFFGPILIVLGTTAALSGAVIGYHSPLVRYSPMRNFQFVGDRRFATGAMIAGGLMLFVGLAIDFALFVVWIANDAPAPDRLALAGLAQALVITGALTGAFGLLYRVVKRQDLDGELAGDLSALVNGVHPRSAPPR